MSVVERAGLALLHQFDPETAHSLSLRALKLGLAPRPGPIRSSRLTIRIAGIELPNPVGLAAGYDKNAAALGPLMQAGFGFLEVGAATPRPQPGNPKPRLFRLTEDAAVINRFGFNNEGVAPISARLRARPHGIPVGLNLGANKDSHDRPADYISVLRAAGHDVDFVTVNVSSPNTEQLRDLQGAEALFALLNAVMQARDEAGFECAVFVKVAPDLSTNEITEVSDVIGKARVDGLIATNTTLDRDGLMSARRDEAGGLSGRPLFEKSTRVLAQFSNALGDDVPIIGVGGISSAKDAYAKIKAGASAVQLYSAMVYQGLSLIPKIANDLDGMLEKDGHSDVAAAVATDRDRWL